MIKALEGTAWAGPAFALASALLFGASTPFAKLLLGHGADPWLLAGMLYTGSGLGLGLFWLLRPRHQDAPLRKSDLPLLALVVFFRRRGGSAAADAGPGADVGIIRLAAAQSRRAGDHGDCLDCLSREC